MRPNPERFLLLAALSAGCVSADAYECATNLDCVDQDGTIGICEAGHSCSFPDTTCPTSQRRYAEGSKSNVADECVDAPAISCIASVQGGDKHFCLLRADGGAACWGANDFGQLGDGTKADAFEPVAVKVPAGVSLIGVYPGEEATCGLSAAGDVYCWGTNENGDLGIATSFTVDDQGNDQPTIDQEGSPTPQKVTKVLAPDGEGHMKAVNAPRFIGLGVGGKHACALSEAQEVYCWGENNRGQCGGSLAQEEVHVPTRVPGLGKNIHAIAPGDEFTLASTEDGSVWAFGDNAYGELGNGSKVEDTATPVEVKITAVAQLAAGASHACAKKEDGSVWCWGYGAAGSLGNGDATDKRIPERITSAASVFTSGLSFHTCAIDVHEQLFCWGQNNTGAVGMGEVSEGADTGIMKPAEAALTTVTMVATSNTATCAVTTDQVLWCWGDNSRGQLGTRAVSKDTLSPLPVRSAFRCE